MVKTLISVVKEKSQESIHISQMEVDRLMPVLISYDLSVLQAAYATITLS